MPAFSSTCPSQSLSTPSRGTSVAAGFTWILCNPPYHVDWAVPKQLLRKGFNRLALHGRMGLVVKRRDWYEDQLRNLFGGVQKLERDGYWILIAEKRSATWAKK